MLKISTTILKVGDEVQVKVLSIDENAGKIGLSIRATEEAPERTEAPAKKLRRNTVQLLLSKQLQMTQLKASIR